MYYKDTTKVSAIFKDALCENILISVLKMKSGFVR